MGLGSVAEAEEYGGWGGGLRADGTLEYEKLRALYPGCSDGVPRALAAADHSVVNIELIVDLLAWLAQTAGPEDAARRARKVTPDPVARPGKGPEAPAHREPGDDPWDSSDDESATPPCETAADTCQVPDQWDADSSDSGAEAAAAPYTPPGPSVTAGTPQLQPERGGGAAGAAISGSRASAAPRAPSAFELFNAPSLSSDATGLAQDDGATAALVFLPGIREISAVQEALWATAEYVSRFAAYL
jgi:hypothetical protein